MTPHQTDASPVPVTDVRDLGAGRRPTDRTVRIWHRVLFGASVAGFSIFALGVLGTAALYTLIVTSGDPYAGYVLFFIIPIGALTTATGALLVGLFAGPWLTVRDRRLRREDPSRLRNPGIAALWTVLFFPLGAFYADVRVGIGATVAWTGTLLYGVFSAFDTGSFVATAVVAVTSAAVAGVVTHRFNTTLMHPRKAAAHA